MHCILQQLCSSFSDKWCYTLLESLHFNRLHLTVRTCAHLLLSVYFEQCIMAAEATALTILLRS